MNIFDVTTFGADPTGKRDSAPGIQTALDSAPGAIVYVPPGIYECYSTLHIRKTQALVGIESGSGWYIQSRLYFSDGTPGIRIEDDPKTGGAQWARIEDLSIHMRYRTKPGADGVTILTSGRMTRCWVEGFTGHGILIRGQTPGNSANLWELHDIQIDRSSGDGLRIEGGDANAGLAEKVSSNGNDGFGIRDISGLGNTYLACHTRTNKGGPYSIGAGGVGLSGVNASVLLGCYAEGDQPASILGDHVYWLGGTNAAPIIGGHVLLPGNSHIRLQGSTTPLTLQSGPKLESPLVTLLDRYGNRTASFSPDGVMGLGTQPGTRYPGDGWTTPPPRLNIWAPVGAPYVQMNTAAGSAALVVADGSGIQVQTIAKGRYSDTIGLQTQRVTIGPGGLQLPSLSRTERAALRSLSPGLMVWGKEEAAVVVWNGSQWTTLG